MGTNSEENPHFGGHLLIIVSEPYTDDHTERILEKVSKGLLSWDVTKTGSDLTGLKDEFIKEFNPEQQKDFIVQYSTERLAVEVLLNPKISVLKQCLNNLLSSSTAYKHVIYAGYAFTGSGSWILRDGAFSFKAFSEIFNNPDVQCVLMKIPECSVHVHCTAEGDWCESSITENMSCVLLNPPDITSSFPGCPELLQYLNKFLVSRSVEEMMKPSAVVGNIRFTRPTLYVFPGGDGNCALFGISGFNMLVDGGFERKPCFWEFVRHIDRLDAMIITRVNENNLNGITSLIKRKQKEHVFPHIGYIFCNITDGKDSPCDEVPKDKDDLLVSILDEGHEFLNNLNNLNLKPHLCFRENGTDPLTLYHKMGHGTLDMYVLNPPKEKKEVKEFFQQWSSKKDNFLSTKNGLKPCDDTSIPLSDLVSISALVVWRPANLKDPITRILITGNAPQSKIFEGLETIKDLEILQQFDCTQSVFRKTVGDKPKLIKNAEKPVAKVLPKPNTSSPSGPQKKTVQKIHVTTAKKDNAIINKTTSERRPSDPIKNLKKNIDSKKLETKVDGKSLESSKDISKTVTPTRKGKELQSSDAKKPDSTLKTATSVERKTKGAKDINNKKTVETKIANKNVRAEIKSKRPETPTKISNVSNETSKKTPTSSPKHSTKLSSSKSVRKPQQMENVKKQEHKLASTKVEEHPKMEEKSSFGLIELKGSLDTEVEFKAKSSVITDVQKMDEDGSLISMVTKTETDTINSLEKALFQPSSDDTGDFDNANLVGYDQSTVKEAVVTETEYLGQINEKVLPQTEQLSEYVLTDKAKDITETGGIQSEKDEVKLDNEVISCNKRELDVSLNKTEGLPQNETFSGNTQDCFQTKHGTNDTSEVLTRMENVPKGEDHDLRVTSTPSVSSDQKCPQTDSDEDQGLNKVNGMTEINLCEKGKGEAEIEFQLRTTTEELDYAERVYGDEEATQFGSIVPDAGVGWSKMDSGIADKDLHSIDNYVSDSKGQGFYEVEKDLFEEDSQRVTIREETEDNFTDKSSKSAPGTDIQYFNGGVADDRSTIVDSSVGDEQIVKSEYQMDKDIEKPVCQNTVENIHDFDVGMSERGQTVQELQSPESFPREPVYLKDQDNYKENISENQTLDKTQLFQQSKDDSENLDCEDKLFASTITSEQSFDEFNVKTNTEEKETTEVKLTEESGSSGSALSISDVKFHHNKGNNMGIPSENEIPETEGLLATHLEESENHSFTTEEMSDIQTGTVLQEHTKIPIFDKIQEKELENQLNQTELAHQNEDDFCFSVKEAIGNVLDPTEQELLKGNACEQMFAIDSAGYSNVHGYSLASEEQKSTLPIDSFNLNYRESNPENLANQCYNQKGSDDFYLNKYDSELSDYKNDQVDFDHRNTINEIKESLYLHPLEKEETGKNSKEQQMISHENNLDQQKTAELLKDHIHVLGSQLGIKSEPHTSDKDYSASETLDAVSDDILPEDGTPCGEVEKSFDQSFSEGFPNSSHEKNLEIKEAIHAVPHEKEITQFMNPDEMYFAHDNAIKHEQEITEDDGEMIRYPTPPGEQDFYEHVGPDAHLKEDHIESGSYILQYDVTGQHSQACEDLTEQPLYEESEEDESERSASPVVEEPVYGSTLTANYPEVVSISEGTTPSEPQSPLDAKQRVQDKTRDHSTEHHNTQEKTEYLENANETNLEQEKVNQ
ncbi:uncharacterized protein LOC143239325 [Tachypleus tridentatus]|uniref:uncharacterized protein LOC143239325 n=1 Tax=Tachypleus tridentatus TaxID=6853 RepID=UPI003FD1270C